MSDLNPRIDFYPTHSHAGYRMRIGDVFPFGATLVPNGVNFSVYSSHATSCTLVLFAKGEGQPLVEIPFLNEFRIGNVYTMTVFDLDVETLEYGFKMDGPWDTERGLRFDPSKILMDPYARVIGGRDVWGVTPNWEDPYQHRARLAFNDFDWEGDRPLEIPIEDLVVYEAHVRSFTRHPSAGVKFPGTFAGLREKIPYLKELGINCLELMPVYEFDEFEHSRPNPETGELLVNYWGYSTVGFFAPKAGYAATGRLGMQVDELKTLVKELHRAGIEVWLDVVFNHTAEGDHRGPTISFRGLDNQVYYMLTPEGYYFNFSGTGNTLNCNHPVVRNMVLDCLRYWAAEYHIDGFRFDLAAILGRDQNGAPLPNPPLLESLAHDPVLAKCKLVAEAWDAGGLYQVGSFPAYGRWAEWNGKYRDAARRFLKGDEGMVAEMAERIAGSRDLYPDRGPTASVNFITAHDGFTLHDMVSYNEKHNHANGENNQDGANDNESWNCGVEGPTDDPEVLALRARQMRNALTLLLVSQGVPMLLMGDEVARTQHGNNNTYCHDNDLNWFDWARVDSQADLWRFTRLLTTFRHTHPVLRNRWHHSFADRLGHGRPDFSWHGVRAWQPDWSPASRTLAFMLDGDHARGGEMAGDSVYVALNTDWQAHDFELPKAGYGRRWHVAFNTSMPAPDDAHEPGNEPPLEAAHLLAGPRSAIVLVAKPIP
jgi:glycogen operon protein